MEDILSLYALGLRTTIDVPGSNANAFWELIINASIPYLDMLISSARNALIASTTRYISLALQNSDNMAISYNCPVDVSSRFTSNAEYPLPSNA